MMKKLFLKLYLKLVLKNIIYLKIEFDSVSI
jgi:hypothetical protein